MDDSFRIAQNFHNIALSLAPHPTIKKVVPDELKNYHVVWDGETVEELATGTKISEHNWNQKLAKINDFYKDFLAGNIKPTQILVAKDTDYSESLIIDGIYRAVGFYKAYLEDHSIISKTDFTYKFFESDKIRLMDDYGRIFGNLS